MNATNTNSSELQKAETTTNTLLLFYKKENYNLSSALKKLFEQLQVKNNNKMVEI